AQSASSLTRATVQAGSRPPHARARVGAPAAFAHQRDAGRSQRRCPLQRSTGRLRLKLKPLGRAADELPSPTSSRAMARAFVVHEAAASAEWQSSVQIWVWG